MKILLSVGHSLLKNGYYTSADGRPFGGVLEYAYNKSIVGDVATYLRFAGHKVDVLICPEKQFDKSKEEKSYKIPKANGGKYDLVVELHLNATSLHNAKGSEVLYMTEEGKKIALRVAQSLSRAFRDRGVAKRTGLYMLNSVKPTSIMIESFFCDNSSDCEIASKTDVALLIAEGIHGSEIKAGDKTKEPQKADSGYLFRFRITVSELNIRKGPGADFPKVGAVTDKNVYTIVETAIAKDGGVWGRLKSGAGWVNVSPKYINKV